MFDHVGIAVSDFERGKRFDADALDPLGYAPLVDVQGWLGFGCDDLQRKPSFWIDEAGQAPTPVNVAFACRGRAQVDAFWEAAVAAGGRDTGAPGIRAHHHPSYYDAFVLDPAGHNVEAVCHAPA